MKTILIMTLFLANVAQAQTVLSRASSAYKMAEILKFIDKSKDFELTDVVGIQRGNMSDYLVNYIQFTGTMLKSDCAVPVTSRTICAPCARPAPPAPPPKCPCATSFEIHKAEAICTPSLNE